MFSEGLNRGFSNNNPIVMEDCLRLAIGCTDICSEGSLAWASSQTDRRSPHQECRDCRPTIKDKIARPSTRRPRATQKLLQFQKRSLNKHRNGSTASKIRPYTQRKSSLSIDPSYGIVSLKYNKNQELQTRDRANPNDTSRNTESGMRDKFYRDHQIKTEFNNTGSIENSPFHIARQSLISSEISHQQRELSRYNQNLLPYIKDLNEAENNQHRLAKASQSKQRNNAFKFESKIFLETPHHDNSHHKRGINAGNSKCHSRAKVDFQNLQQSSEFSISHQRNKLGKYQIPYTTSCNRQTDKTISKFFKNSQNESACQQNSRKIINVIPNYFKGKQKKSNNHTVNNSPTLSNSFRKSNLFLEQALTIQSTQGNADSSQIKKKSFNPSISQSSQVDGTIYPKKSNGKIIDHRMLLMKESSDSSELLSIGSQTSSQQYSEPHLGIHVQTQFSSNLVVMNCQSPINKVQFLKQPIVCDSIDQQYYQYSSKGQGIGELQSQLTSTALSSRKDHKKIVYFKDQNLKGSDRISNYGENTVISRFSNPDQESDHVSVALYKMQDCSQSSYVRRIISTSPKQVSTYRKLQFFHHTRSPSHGEVTNYDKLKDRIQFVNNMSTSPRKFKFLCQIEAIQEKNQQKDESLLNNSKHTNFVCNLGSTISSSEKQNFRTNSQWCAMKRQTIEATKPNQRGIQSFLRERQNPNLAKYIKGVSKSMMGKSQLFFSEKDTQIIQIRALGNPVLSKQSESQACSLFPLNFVFNIHRIQASTVIPQSLKEIHHEAVIAFYYQCKRINQNENKKIIITEFFQYHLEEARVRSGGRLKENVCRNYMRNILLGVKFLCQKLTHISFTLSKKDFAITVPSLIVKINTMTLLQNSTGNIVGQVGDWFVLEQQCQKTVTKNLERNLSSMATILYQMLYGYIPNQRDIQAYLSSNRDSLGKNIIQAKINKELSSNCKNFTAQLLKFKSKQPELTIDQLLQHQWLEKDPQVVQSNLQTG